MWAYVSASTSARCVLTIHQMGTADAEILSTQRFQTLSLLRNDVPLEDCMHLILLASQATVIRYRKRFRSLLLCLLLCVRHKSVYRLLLMLFYLSFF